MQERRLLVRVWREGVPGSGGRRARERQQTPVLLLDHALVAGEVPRLPSEKPPLVVVLVDVRLQNHDSAQRGADRFHALPALVGRFGIFVGTFLSDESPGSTQWFPSLPRMIPTSTVNYGVTWEADASKTTPECPPRPPPRRVVDPRRGRDHVAELVGVFRHAQLGEGLSPGEAAAGLDLFPCPRLRGTHGARGELQHVEYLLGAQVVALVLPERLAPPRPLGLSLHLRVGQIHPHGGGHRVGAACVAVEALPVRAAGGAPAQAGDVGRARDEVRNLEPERDAETFLERVLGVMGVLAQGVFVGKQKALVEEMMGALRVLVSRVGLEKGGPKDILPLI